MKISALYEKFQKPGAQWRGKPFWSWNGELEKALSVEVSFPGQFLYAEEPEAGKVAPAEAIAANTLRLYVYRRAK